MVLDMMRRIDSVLGVMDFEEEKLEADAARLMKERHKARAAGDWDEADRLRRELDALGILVHDTPKGTTWTVK